MTQGFARYKVTGSRCIRFIRLEMLAPYIKTVCVIGASVQSFQFQFNSIYYRNTTGINTVFKLRNNKQYVPIVFYALIISLELFGHDYMLCTVTGRFTHEQFARGQFAQNGPPKVRLG